MSGSGLMTKEMPLKRSKTLLKKAPELKYFRKGDPTEGQGDASKNRLDFLLIQQGEPVTLPFAERKYSKIEK